MYCAWPFLMGIPALAMRSISKPAKIFDWTQISPWLDHPRLLCGLPQITDHTHPLFSDHKTLAGSWVGSVQVSICYLLIEHTLQDSDHPHLWPSPQITLTKGGGDPTSFLLPPSDKPPPWDKSIPKIRVQASSSVWARNGSHPFRPHPLLINHWPLWT